MDDEFSSIQKLKKLVLFLQFTHHPLDDDFSSFKKLKKKFLFAKEVKEEKRQNVKYVK